jgi:hypothetical protein
VFAPAFSIVHQDSLEVLWRKLLMHSVHHRGQLILL